MYSAITENKIKTLLLLAVFIAFISSLGYFFGLSQGNPSMLYFFGIGSLIYSLVMYFASAKIALGMAGAKEISKKDAPELYRMVENLTITAGLPMPKVYIIDDPSPNAFATGRDPKHAAVAVTTGLLERLENEELQGVIAHELGHVGNYDIRLMSVVTALVSIVSIISDLFFWFGGSGDEDSPSPIFLIGGLIMAILAPIIATIIQLAISRRREYLADASAVMLTRYADGLANALRKISDSNLPVKHASSATAHLYIANPLGGKGIGAGIAKLFSTHPPIEDRIAKLQKMAVSA